MKLTYNLGKPQAMNPNKLLFNKNMNYYICSSGGCGSTLIFEYLKTFGNVYHIHDRYPPEKLCYVGKENTTEDVYSEWFNTTEIPDDKLQFYKVIFIYRNPIYVIFSRFIQPQGPNIAHLQHIKCKNNGLIGLGDIVNNGMDLYGLEEFYNNYTSSKKRNYSIYCVKYEDFFNNIDLFNETIQIPNIKALYPTKNERRKHFTYLKILSIIYYKLLIKMQAMPFIKIVSPIKEIVNDDDDV